MVLSFDMRARMVESRSQASAALRRRVTTVLDGKRSWVISGAGSPAASMAAFERNTPVPARSDLPMRPNILNSVGFLGLLRPPSRALSTGILKRPGFAMVRLSVFRSMVTPVSPE